MATTSIKQTIELIEDTITNYFSDEVKAVYFEKFADTQKEKIYPRLSYYYSTGGKQLDVNTNVISFDFEFLDAISGRENKDERRKEVVSDMFQVASKFIAYLRDKENVLITMPVQLETFDNKYKDGLGGVSFTLSINIIRPCLIV